MDLLAPPGVSGLEGPWRSGSVETSVPHAAIHAVAQSTPNREMVVMAVRDRKPHAIPLKEKATVSAAIQEPRVPR